jgi:DNA-binding GntR family transcriptional regulator
MTKGHAMAAETNMALADAVGTKSRRQSAPVVRPAPLRAAVVDALVDMIISRELLPGERLVENELAETLGVSRQPIREAFQQLQSEGWIDQLAGKGAFVHAPTDKEARDLLHVRAMLEKEATWLAAEHATPADVTELRRICAIGRQAVLDQDFDTVVEVNSEFHARIQVIADNPVLTSISQTVAARVRFYHVPIAAVRGIASWDEHEAIIDAIEAGASERAKALMGKHTGRTRATLLEARPA